MTEAGTDAARSWTTDAARPDTVIALQATLNRWEVSTPANWERRHQLARAIAAREAMCHTADAAVLDVCERVAICLEAGQWPDEALYDDTFHAMDAAAARAAARAAHSAVSARDAANAAASSADRVYWAFASPARDAAADRVTAAILKLP